jgi:hypothetical protein
MACQQGVGLGGLVTGDRGMPVGQTRPEAWIGGDDHLKTLDRVRLNNNMP